MKITAREARSLMASLVSLDGYDKPAGTSGAVVRQPYKFPPHARVAIARNIAKLQEVDTIITNAARGLLLQHSNGEEVLPKEKAAIFSAEMHDILETVHDIDLKLIAETDLCLSENQLPSSVLAMMMKIILEYQDHAEAAE